MNKTLFLSIIFVSLSTTLFGIKGKLILIDKNISTKITRFRNNHLVLAAQNQNKIYVISPSKTISYDLSDLDGRLGLITSTNKDGNLFITTKSRDNTLVHQLKLGKINKTWNLNEYHKRKGWAINYNIEFANSQRTGFIIKAIAPIEKSQAPNFYFTPELDGYQPIIGLKYKEAQYISDNFKYIAYFSPESKSYYLYHLDERKHHKEIYENEHKEIHERYTAIFSNPSILNSGDFILTQTIYGNEYHRGIFNKKVVDGSVQDFDPLGFTRLMKQYISKSALLKSYTHISKKNIYYHTYDGAKFIATVIPIKHLRFNLVSSSNPVYPKANQAIITNARDRNTQSVYYYPGKRLVTSTKYITKKILPQLKNVKIPFGYKLDHIKIDNVTSNLAAIYKNPKTRKAAVLFVEF